MVFSKHSIMLLLPTSMTACSASWRPAEQPGAVAGYVDMSTSPDCWSDPGQEVHTECGLRILPLPSLGTS